MGVTLHVSQEIHRGLLDIYICVSVQKKRKGGEEIRKEKCQQNMSVKSVVNACIE